MNRPNYYDTEHTVPWRPRFIPMQFSTCRHPVKPGQSCKELGCQAAAADHRAVQMARDAGLRKMEGAVSRGFIANVVARVRLIGGRSG